jgi:hypothetical protein
MMTLDIKRVGVEVEMVFSCAINIFHAVSEGQLLRSKVCITEADKSADVFRILN